MTVGEVINSSPEELEDYTADLINTFFKDTYDESAAKYRKANEKSVFTAEELDRLSKMVACPYCKCYNTKKISTTSKVLHTALFGIFSVSRNLFLKNLPLNFSAILPNLRLAAAPSFSRPSHP